MKAGHVISSCLVGTVLGTVVVAGRFQQAGPSQPSFRSSVNLVLVDMRVASGANQIADLRIDEITLLVDGARRPIVSLDYHPTRQHANLPAVDSHRAERDSVRLGVGEARPRRSLLRGCRLQGGHIAHHREH